MVMGEEQLILRQNNYLRRSNRIMYNNQFYNHFFNQQFVTPSYYSQIQNQVEQYQKEQTEEVKKVVKSVHELCEAYQRLDNEHQRQAFYLALAAMAGKFGW